MYMINKLILPKYNRYWRLFIDSLKHSLFSLFQFLPKCQALNRKSFEIRIQKYLFWTVFGPVSKLTNWKRIWQPPCCFAYLSARNVFRRKVGIVLRLVILYGLRILLFFDKGKDFTCFSVVAFAGWQKQHAFCVLASQSTDFSENEYGLHESRAEIL